MIWLLFILLALSIFLNILIIGPSSWIVNTIKQRQEKEWWGDFSNVWFLIGYFDYYNGINKNYALLEQDFLTLFQSYIKLEKELAEYEGINLETSAEKKVKAGNN